MEEPRPEVRIGDRERRAVDAHLQQALADGVLTLSEYDERAAQCWAARTRSELDALTRDLPEYRPEPDTTPTPAAPSTPADEPRRDVGKRVKGGILGVVLAAGALFLGGQAVTADAVSVFGGRTLHVTPGQDRVDVASLFGGVTVVVPDDVRARVTGATLFGGTDCEQACRRPGREVVVDVVGAFGGVNVLSEAEYAQRADRDADDDRDED